MSRLPGKRLGIKIGSTPSSALQGVQLEVFVDFTCPFSRKIYHKLVEVKDAYGDKLELIMQPMPQSWHPASVMVHEGFHAACLAYPAKDTMLFDVMMRDAMTHFGDTHTFELSRKQVHEQICALFEKGCDGVDTKSVMKHLALDTSGGQVNGGNNATRVLKFYVKQHRQLSVHVTPSIRVNGLLCDSSSSWEMHDWRALLDPIMALDYV